MATFTDGADDIPIKSCVVQIILAQEGSGDPSPDNVRPIAGWTGCTISHSGADTTDPDTLTISWETEASTIYGGTLTLNEDGSCDLVRTWIGSKMSDLTWSFNSTRNCFESEWISRPVQTAGHISNCCSMYKAIANSAYPTEDLVINFNSTSAITRSYFRIMDNSCNGDVSAFVSKITEKNGFVTWKVQSQLYRTNHFDNVGQLCTFLGANSFWADTGNVNLTYRADIPITIQNLKDAIVSLGGNV